MALVIEDGTGKSDAESYISVADAETYLSAHGNTTWAAASTADKEVALRKGTRYLDLVYGRRWKERRTHETQALDWPRAYIQDQDDFTIDADEIPVNIQRATAELGLLALTEDILPDIAAGSQRIRSESKAVGPISKSQTFIGGKAERKRYTKVHEMVAEFLNPPGMVTRG